MQEASGGPVAVAAVASELNGHRKKEEYVNAWAAVESRIRSGFYARKGRKAEMDRLLAKTKPLAEAATSDAEFKARIEEMIAAFGDSHFDLLTKLDQGYYMFDSLVRGTRAEMMPSIGAWYRADASGRWRVTMVMEGSEAAKAGLQVGDEIREADGGPFAPVASLAGHLDHVVTLSYERGGKTATCVVTPKAVNSLGEFLAASKASERVIRSGGKKIAYMHLWTLATNDFRDALSAAVYGPLSDTDAMILDLRDGFGGRPEGFADPFFRPDALIEWDYSTAHTKQHFGYSKPLVVLINGGSRSAKELLSYILKKSHRAKLIGETTAGNVLGTSPNRLNAWSFLEIPMVDVAVDGVRLEKNGMRPDIEVRPEYGPNGTDLVLQRAVRELTK
jgi:carboxyl-terminal processing protease